MIAVTAGVVLLTAGIVVAVVTGKIGAKLGPYTKILLGLIGGVSLGLRGPYRLVSLVSVGVGALIVGAILWRRHGDYYLRRQPPPG